MAFYNRVNPIYACTHGPARCRGSLPRYRVLWRTVSWHHAWTHACVHRAKRPPRLDGEPTKLSLCEECMHVYMNAGNLFPDRVVYRRPIQRQAGEGGDIQMYAACSHTHSASLPLPYSIAVHCHLKLQTTLQTDRPSKRKSSVAICLNWMATDILVMK
eukprot:365777-Chlamydomonas_euryale.AAC.4